MASAMLLPQLASGAILLAGFNEFPTALPGNATKPVADEGLLATAAPAANSFAGTRLTAPNGFSGSTGAAGGSYDNWYGPDSEAKGGLKTGQSPFNQTGWTAEVAGAPRLNNVNGGGFTPFQPGTTLNGRITNADGTSVFVFNNTQNAIPLESFVFDAFLGDATTGPIDTKTFANFTVTVAILDATGGVISSTSNPNISITRAYNGLNPQDGSPAGSLKTDPNAVDNKIDAGTGTDYLDYVVSLGGLTLPVNGSFQIQFNTGGNGVVRLDNLALFAVPEPSSVMTLAALVGSGCFFRRRKLA